MPRCPRVAPRRGRAVAIDGLGRRRRRNKSHAGVVEVTWAGIRFASMACSREYSCPHRHAIAANEGRRRRAEVAPRPLGLCSRPVTIQPSGLIASAATGQSPRPDGLELGLAPTHTSQASTPDAARRIEAQFRNHRFILQRKRRVLGSAHPNVLHCQQALARLPTAEALWSMPGRHR